MASRGFQYFMQPVEYLSLIQEIATQLELKLWLISTGVKRDIELVTGHASLLTSTKKPVYWIGLSREQGELPSVFSSPLQPAKWGWVLAEVPRLQDNILYIAQLSAKSDWVDLNSGQYNENHTSFELFRAIRARWQSKLFRPVYIESIESGSIDICKGVWYSAGVIEWNRNGGQLRQEGVLNTRFVIREVSSP
jgi:hypothetical protein